MPEDNATKGPIDSTQAASSNSKTNTNIKDQPSSMSNSAENPKIISDIVDKINDAHNILIALSADPSVDEMSAAIGLSLFLDKLGKRATAIYSGATPNALEFLKPEETFEPTIDALQDFVIALNKDKADHLRYKLDGEFVKIYITPYRTRISEDDLDYSYGDFNIDLVLSLNVANGIDLDAALREHGRIMHDAAIVNIAAGNPGKLGEIEWSDKTASSVSEMVARLIYSMNSKTKMEAEEATALLTGIVAATNRFSNSKTTSESMQISSRLMESGANQQLISKNITADTENEMLDIPSNPTIPQEPENSNENEEIDDSAKLDISHGDDNEAPENLPEDNLDTVKASPEPDLLDDLKAAEATLAQTGADTTPEAVNGPVKIDSDQMVEQETSSTEKPQETGLISDKPEKIIQPSSESLTESSNEIAGNKYSQMLEDALTNIENPTAPQSSNQNSSNANPATMNAPVVPTAPEINGVPTMNYLPLPSDQVLPPPPTPPIDIASPPPTQGNSATVNQPSLPQPTATAAPAAPIVPAAPMSEPAPSSLGSQPAMQDQVYGPQASDPSAFKIPGM